MPRTTFAFLLAFLLLASCNSREQPALGVASFQPIDLGKQANVSCFDIEPNGSMWLGLDGEGLAYKESAGTPYQFFNRLSGTLPSDVVICCYRDSRERLWFGTFGNGMFYWDGRAFHQPETEGLRSLQLEYVSGFMEDASGSLWIATQKEGIVSCDTTGRVDRLDESNSGLATNWIAGFATFDRRDIFIATGWGLFVLDTETRQVAPVVDSHGQAFLAKQLVRSLMADDAGRLWIGTRTGLYIFNKVSHTYTRLTTDDGLGDNFVKAIGRDLLGHVWVTSENTITCISARASGEYACHAFREEDG